MDKTNPGKKNIKVEIPTYDKLVRIKGYLQAKTGKRTTFSDAIDATVEASEVWKKAKKIE